MVYLLCEMEGCILIQITSESYFSFFFIWHVDGPVFSNICVSVLFEYYIIQYEFKLS